MIEQRRSRPNDLLQGQVRAGVPGGGHAVGGAGRGDRRPPHHLPLPAGAPQLQRDVSGHFLLLSDGTEVRIPPAPYQGSIR